MVTVTERAKEVLRALLIDNSKDPEEGIRLVFSPSGQIGLTLDKPREGDQIVESEGSKVLLVAPETAIALPGAVIDCVDTEEGPHLVIS